MSALELLGNIPEILRVEALLKTLPQVDLPVTHYQIEGVYVRSMFIPKGTALTGKIHLKESIAILAQGVIRIADQDKSYIISAPYIVVDAPGIKRLGWAETDVTFITVHRTDQVDIPAIEEELVVLEFDEYEQRTQLQLGEQI